MNKHLTSRVITGNNIEFKLNAFLASIREDQFRSIERFSGGIIVLYVDDDSVPENLELYLQEVERTILARALRVSFGDPTDAANSLSITPPDFRMMLRKHKIAFSVKKTSERRKAIRLNQGDLPIDMKQHLEDREKHMIILALKKHQGNQGRAAKELRLKSRSTLQNKMAKHNINREDYIQSEESTRLPKEPS